MGRVANSFLQRWDRLLLRLTQAGSMSPELRHAALNSKLLGAELARRMYAAGQSGPGQPAADAPVHVARTRGVARQHAIEAP